MIVVHVMSRGLILPIPFIAVSVLPAVGGALLRVISLRGISIVISAALILRWVFSSTCLRGVRV